MKQFLLIFFAVLGLGACSPGGKIWHTDSVDKTTSVPLAPAMSLRLQYPNEEGHRLVLFESRKDSGECKIIRDQKENIDLLEVKFSRSELTADEKARMTFPYKKENGVTTVLGNLYLSVLDKVEGRDGVLRSYYSWRLKKGKNNYCTFTQQSDGKSLKAAFACTLYPARGESVHAEGEVRCPLTNPSDRSPSRVSPRRGSR